MSPKEFIHEAKTSGLRLAWNHFWHRRHLPILAYLLLTAAISYAIYENRQYYTTTQHQQDKQYQVVLHRICNNGNELRKVLRGIVYAGEISIKKQGQQHLFPKAVVDNAVHQEEASLQELGNQSCSRYSVSTKVR